MALQSLFSLPKHFFFSIKDGNREQWKPADSPEVAVGFTACSVVSLSN